MRAVLVVCTFLVAGLALPDIGTGRVSAKSRGGLDAAAVVVLVGMIFWVAGLGLRMQKTLEVGGRVR